MSKLFPITEFDSFTLPSTLQMFKAIIPFMDFELQRNLSTLIRTDELIHTMNFYKTPSNCKCFKTCSSSFRISSSSSIQDILSNESILSQILKYCPEETENTLRQFKNFSKMSDLFNNYHPNAGSGFVFDEGALLNPAQQKLYNQYIHQLDEIDLNKK